MGRPGPPHQPLRSGKLFGLSGAGARAFHEPPLRGVSERGAARGSGQSGVQHNAHAAGGLPRRTRPGRGSECRCRPRLGASAELHDRTALRRLCCSRRAGGAPHRRLPRGGVAVIEMSGERVERRLAAILAVDVAGYSRLMGEDEEGTHGRLKAHLRELIDPRIRVHHGRIVKNTGDGLLAEFPSVVDAVRCAVEMQRGMTDREPDMPEARRIRFRIGVNLGDVIVEEHDIFGDGVNVAARLEALAEPGGICISREVRDQIRDKLPYAFEDMGEQQVKNIARPVRTYAVALGASSRAALSAGAPLPLPDKPSLAVLPIQNLTGDTEQEYFVDGMVEEITTAIARLPWLFVIARNSAFTYKGKPVDVKQVAQELGVRYVLEGSVRKAGSRVRISAQLIDTTTGAHIWADRFDGALDDIFELQDLVASNVAGAIEPKLRRSEIERASRKPTANLTAYDLYLRALAQSSRYTEESLAEAVVLARRALTIDPSYAPAAALVGRCRWV